MKKKIAIVEEKEDEKSERLVRNYKKNRVIRKTTIDINESILGDSIEKMIERLKEGEGEDGITDRDLVYNDNETIDVNPVTNIRTDKMEKMLEEKIGEYEHRNRTLKIVKDEPEEEKTGTEHGETQTEE